MRKLMIVLLVAMSLLLVAGCTTGQGISQGTLVPPSQGITKGDLLLLAVPSPTTYPGEILEYKGADRSSQTQPKIKFKQWSTGETLEYDIAGDQVSILLGGRSFLVNLLNTRGINSPLQVDFDGDGVLDVKDQKMGKLYYKLGATSVLGSGGTTPTCEPTAVPICETILSCNQVLDLLVNETASISYGYGGNRTTGVGERVGGLTLLYVDTDNAVVEFEGEQRDITLGITGVFTNLNVHFLYALNQDYAGGVHQATLCLN